jgi:threonine dehydratase
MSDDLPTFADIEAAARRIAGKAVRTPLLNAPVLSERLGGRIFLKPECLQRTGSFKFRGACNAITALGEAAERGIVAGSSGNHAQGIAEAARLAGVRAAIVMPSDAPEAKRTRTAASGATIVAYDRATEDREAIAMVIAERDGATFIHAYDNPQVIAGQGTVGLEIADDCAGLGVTPDIVLVNCSGGGLTAGTALAVSERFPDAGIYTVEPEGFDDYRRSLAAGHIVANEKMSGSVCDALLSREPGGIGFAINKERLAGGLAVTDDAALQAVGFAYEQLRLIVEPGGAVALAALLGGQIEVAGKTVIVVLSGGNIDDAVLQRGIAAYRSKP